MLDIKSQKNDELNEDGVKEKAFSNYLVGSNANSEDENDEDYNSVKNIDIQNLDKEEKEETNATRNIQDPSDPGDLKFDKALLFKIEEELRKQKLKHA